MRWLQHVGSSKLHKCLHDLPPAAAKCDAYRAHFHSWQSQHNLMRNTSANPSLWLVPQQLEPAEAVQPRPQTTQPSHLHTPLHVQHQSPNHQFCATHRPGSAPLMCMPAEAPCTPPRAGPRQQLALATPTVTTGHCTPTEHRSWGPSKLTSRPGMLYVYEICLCRRLLLPAFSQ